MSRKWVFWLRLLFRERLPLLGLLALIAVPLLVGGCGKKVEAPKRPPAEVAVITIEPRDTPITVEYVGQTQSSHQVEIRARVSGFLEKRTYTEGSAVKSGQVMFKMDPKPFQAQLDAAKGALAQQQARLITAQANLKRVKPLTEQNALSQKDLDDATGAAQAAAAAVETAKADVEQAQLNLSYCTISSPVTGLSSYARVQDGAYVNVQNSLLTYVAQTEPMWVNFSISENDQLKYQGEAERGSLRLPKDDEWAIEVILADGSVFPKRGRIFFADAEYNQQTGTFLIRSTLPNPKGVLKPGQFVRVHVLGAMRPKAIVIPQRAVQQGAKGHFVWVAREGKAEARPVVVGDWLGNSWFISEGLKTGDKVIVDGGLALQPGAPVTIKAQASTDVQPGAPVTVKGKEGTAERTPPEAPKTGEEKTKAPKGDK